jgi:hypothetical protein
MKSKREKERIQAIQRATKQRTNEDIMSYVKKNTLAKAAEQARAKLPRRPPTQAEVWESAQNENLDKIWPPAKTPPADGSKS